MMIRGLWALLRGRDGNGNGNGNGNDLWDQCHVGHTMDHIRETWPLKPHQKAGSICTNNISITSTTLQHPLKFRMSNTVFNIKAGILAPKVINIV